MKIAIVYATCSGVAGECASLLQKELKNHETELFDLSRSSPDPKAFDLTVLGFSIRMGKLSKKAKNYMKEHHDALLRGKTAYFICCGFIDCFANYAKKNIPQDLRESALDTVCFGGLLDPKRVKGIDRIIVKMVRNEILGGGENADQRDDMVLPTILENNIAQLAEKIKDA